MQLKLQKPVLKPSTGQQWQKYSPCLLYLSNISLSVVYIALLLYSLIWEAGNIVNLPTKRIGFYNFCLWDQEAEKLDCLMFNSLEKMGVNTVALILSRIFVYFTPVLCLFVATTVLQSLCFKDRDGLKMACTLLGICSFLLPVGLALFLFYTNRWIQVSDLGEVFVALIGAQVLLLLHLFIIVLHLARFKDHLPKDSWFLQGTSHENEKCMFSTLNSGMNG